MNEINQTTRIFDIAKKLWDRYQIAVMQERPFLPFVFPCRAEARPEWAEAYLFHFQTFRPIHAFTLPRIDD